MATVVENRPAGEDRGLGVAGIIAIIVVVLLAAFLLLRWTGARNQNGTSGAGINVSGQVQGTTGGTAGSY